MVIGITGASGMLGSSIKTVLNKENIVGVDIGRSCFTKYSRAELLAEYLVSEKISCLVHCAANTDVDLCELDPSVCLRDNIILTELVATACKISNIKIVFISSTGVYGDYKKTPYVEDDPARPTTVHHHSKWFAERVVAGACPDSLIIRTGWLFGGVWIGKKNFVAKRIAEAQNSKGVIRSDESQFGCPTYALDVARCIVVLIRNNISGTFNCVNEGLASRYEYVSSIIQFSELEVDVQKHAGDCFKRPAKVSKNEMALNKRLKALSLFEMPDWRDSLKNYIVTQLSKQEWKKRKL